MSNDPGLAEAPVSSGQAGTDALIRLQPIPQTNKLRGPGSGSDDDLSIPEDVNASNGPEGERASQT